MKKKKRIVTFNITIVGDKDEDFGDATIDIEFVGDLYVGACIEAIHRGLLNNMNKCINGKVLDCTLCT